MRFTIEDVFLSPADAEGRKKMMERLEEKHGNINCTVIARSILSRPIEAFYIGRGKKYITVFGAHHALESITTNIGYILADYISTMADANILKGVDCKLLLSKFCFVIVPCMNPDGIEMRYHGAEKSPLYDRQMRMSCGDFSSWQANGRGVDLNHNYDFGFHEYKRIETGLCISAGATLFSGEYPESEPETKGAANLVRTLLPLAVVSLHSQGEEIFAFPDTVKARRIGKRLAELTGYELSSPEGTAAYGGLCDYTASLGIPSFTFEVGKGKNPLSESSVPEIFERVGRAAVLLPTLL